jgi:hypothetical protein
VSIAGAGVHWRCTAVRSDATCSISCYHHRIVEYYTSFERDSSKIATARTSDKQGTISAVADWLDGAALALLYDRYPFVDGRKRSLSLIRDTVVRSQPLLAQAAEISHQGADIYCLKFRAEDRACQISYYGKNDLPDAKFAWDQTELFEYQPSDHAQLARLLHRWVCDQAEPSQIRREFPFLQIGELADYYERGQRVEGEFLQSWDRIEEDYQRDRCQASEAVLSLIRAMRRAGYDRLLRAGRSLLSLGLSRSRRHGLRAGQPCLWFQFHDARMDVIADFAGVKLTGRPIEFTPDIQRLLDALDEFDID